ncbi:hypothetical protein PGT21_000154 [Puccinia graminis f. sp. tritici]|uniref:Uncharacterized protein n=1 Tax=Puccinia graminis f. sp. tritici TaxID=56615 RepID=A0A5B0LKH3_PUCGR|nr:hypothetical protein PGT21_000154 [Puccinia graminis f. sp. tritici]
MRRDHYILKRPRDESSSARGQSHLPHPRPRAENDSARDYQQNDLELKTIQLEVCPSESDYRGTDPELSLLQLEVPFLSLTLLRPTSS